MLNTKQVGHRAASRKYDILTALGAYALAMTKTEQRNVLRFITLITARYNWGHDDLSIGQREIAHMWSCDERTVKRVMARFRANGWLNVRIQGARGRVTSYKLGVMEILQMTEQSWRKVGPDFEMRMSLGKDVKRPDDNVIPLSTAAPVATPDTSSGTEWALAQAILHKNNPARFGAWLASLERVDRVGGQLTLKAPTKFHASYVLSHLMGQLMDVCSGIDDTLSEIRIVV